MMCMNITITALFLGRGSLGVAVLAMTDVTRRNDTNIEVTLVTILVIDEIVLEGLRT